MRCFPVSFEDVVDGELRLFAYERLDPGDQVELTDGDETIVGTLLAEIWSGNDMWLYRVKVPHT